MRPDDSVYRLAFESAPTGIVICDDEGTILSANQRIEPIFGYPPTEVVGHRLSHLIPSIGQLSDSAGPAPGVPTPTGSASVACDVNGRRKDGSAVRVQAALTVVGGSGQPVTIAYIAEISDRAVPGEQLTDHAREHARFEQLVTDLAARCVMAGSERVDGTIVDSLRQMSEALGVDRMSWWRVSDQRADASMVHSWTRPEYRVMQRGESAGAQVPWILSRLQEGEIVQFTDADELPHDTDRETMRRFGTKSGAAVPFLIDGTLRAILGFGAMRRRDWGPQVIDRLRLVAAVFGQALMCKESEQHLHAALSEVRDLRDQLAMENLQLRREAAVFSVPHMVVAESPATKRVLEQIESVAPTSATVLLIGETGTGKEVFAQAIHRASERGGRPMVTVNCAAIPSTLIESELFGHERGAYTGAVARQIGRFEMANDSTIFLDEIGELSLDVQVKLLRVLQEKVIERLGSGQSVKVNVRIIAATNRNLEKAIEERTFREDLYYRLNVFPIAIPPLRERVLDIPALVWSFVDEYSNEFHKPIESISKESLEALQRYAWPGNVRELRNVIERAVIVAKGPRLTVAPPVAASASHKSTRLADVEAEQIQRVLESAGWRVRGAGGAAELLGLKPNTLDSRIAKLGIRRRPVVDRDVH
jgi:formate hydrogenlyase transcriptional activator